jgi:hypothetical protein
MLYLNPPYYVISGVSVFADHADKRQFYYLPASPHLSMTNDPTTNALLPKLELLRFTGADRSGGFLSFDVNLGFDPDLLENEVKPEIRRLFELDDDPILSPVLLESGSVRLIALDAETPVPGAPPPEPPADGAPVQLVTKIDHAESPSLYGDCQAIFSASLNEDGAKLIDDALLGTILPVGVIYELEFAALRPAYQFKVTADWNRVQTHFEEMASARIAFFSSEIDKAIDKLVEDQVIKIEVDNFVPAGDEQALLTDPKKLIDQIKDMVIQTFFKPTLNPADHGKDGWDRATDIATELSTLAVSGGWAGVATFSYRKVDLTRIDNKHLDVEVQERTAVRRKIYPQAHLEGLTRPLRDANGQLHLDDIVRDVHLDDDPFFMTRTVTAHSTVDLKAENIDEIGVRLTYAGQAQDLILTPDKPDQDVHWSSRVVNGQVVTAVEASYEVRFSGAQGVEHPSNLRSLTSVVDDNIFTINPHDDAAPLYAVRSVAIVGDGMPWDRYPIVEVALRYSDPANHIAQSDTLRLTASQQTQTWPQFIGDLAHTSFDYQLTFRAADNRDVVEDWVTIDRDDITVRDPRSAALVVQVVPAFGWDLVSSAFVDLTYDDDDNGVHVDKSISLTKENLADNRFEVHLADRTKRIVHYQVRLLLTDNSLVEQPPSMTRASQIFLRADLKGHRIVTVHPAAVDFTAKKVRQVKVSLSMSDQVNGLIANKEISFSSQDDIAYFEFDYVVAGSGYQLESTTIFNDGFSAHHAASTVDVDDLVIPVG